MTQAALEFQSEDRIGRVSSVDTSKVLIDVEDPKLMTRIGVGNLVAVRGATEREFLIGMTERVTRSLREGMPDDNIEDKEVISLGAQPEDLIRIVLVGTYKTVSGSESDIFKRGADSFPQIDRDCFLIRGCNLQNLMNLLAADIPEKEQLALGHFVMDSKAKAVASGDRFFQRHASILGSTGSGKSWAVSLVLEKASKLAHSNIIVFDLHGEYEPLSDANDGFSKGFKIAGPGDLTDPADDVIFLPYWLLNRDEMLSMILDRSDQNAPNQASRFTGHVRKLKEETLTANKKDPVKDTFTVDSPIPYEIADLVKQLEDDDTRKGVGAKGQPIKGEWEGRLTRFISRLKAKLEDRRYGFMFHPPVEAQDYDWLAKQILALVSAGSSERGIKVVDFSEVPSDVLPIVTGTFARLLYDIQFWLDPDDRTPIAIVCDEAHLYLPVKENADAVERQALYTFERIAKEGRKYGVSLVVVSQRPSDVSRTILSQCNNFLVLRLTNDRDQSVVRRLMPDSMTGLIDILPLLDTGEAVLLGDAILLPTRIKLDIPTKPPASSTKQFWKEWSSNEPDGLALKEAVENLRRQTRMKAK